MSKQSFHATTTSTRVFSFPQKTRRQLANLRGSAQRPCIRCLSGFARFDTKTRTTPLSFVDRFSEREATLDRRTSGSAFVCNSGYYGSDATLYFDGGSKGKKGPGGGGAFLLDINGECIWEGYRFCGNATCTQAEYHGLILGLDAAREANIDNLTIYGDADIVLDQMMGDIPIKSRALKQLYQKACDLASCLNVHYIVIDSDDNGDAHELATNAMNNENDYSEWYSYESDNDNDSDDDDDDDWDDDWDDDYEDENEDYKSRVY